MEELTTPTEDVTTSPADPDRVVEAPTEEPVSTGAPAEGQPDNAAKGSKDFTPEERATIIAKAKEVGTAKAANEFGIKARLISYWIQQEKKKASKPSKAKSKDLKHTPGKSRVVS